MSTKYILEKIRVEGALQDLMTKSDGDNVSVVYNGTATTLTQALATILADITALPDGEEVDAKVSAAVSALVGGSPETADTLKELFDLISTNSSAMDTLNAAIGNKLDKSVFDTFKGAIAQLGALAGKDKVAETDLDDALKSKIDNAAAGNHSHDNKTVLDGITAEKVAAWDGVRGVRYGAEPPADMKDGELFIRVVSQA